LTAQRRNLPRRLAAVIFDLDDTLVVSTVDYAKFKRLVIERIVEDGEPRSAYSPNELILIILERYKGAMRARGLTDQEVKQRLTALDGIMDAVELEMVSETLPIDGAAEVLAMLRAKGVKIGILTRGCREYAEAALKMAGMEGLVDAIEGRSSETKPKPDPESYLRLARALGVDPRDTVYVGDHPMDAECALNAGAPFIGVMTGDVPEDELMRAGSLAVFRDVGLMLVWLEQNLAD